MELEVFWQVATFGLMYVKEPLVPWTGLELFMFFAHFLGLPRGSKSRGTELLTF